MKAFKAFTFDAAHQLPDWPGVHGHSYTVTVWVRAENAGDYVVRESTFETALSAVRGELDHHYLNDIIAVPTSENIARHVHARATSLGLPVCAVQVHRDSCRFGVLYEPEAPPVGADATLPPLSALGPPTHDEAGVPVRHAAMIAFHPRLSRADCERVVQGLMDQHLLDMSVYARPVAASCVSSYSEEQGAPVLYHP